MERLSLDVLNSFKPVNVEAIDDQLHLALNSLNRKIVVLDDDPTGVQTVHDVSVYTSWDKEAITAGFQEPANLFFILTNSRGFTKNETIEVHREIGITLAELQKRQVRISS
jgi:uncharacterized protein YgbK (DUF1537 family)